MQCGPLHPVIGADTREYQETSVRRTDEFTVLRRIGEAHVLAALSRLWLADDPTESQRLLEQALTLRRAIRDVYGEGADLGNYGIALAQHGRSTEALPYLRRARELFAARGLERQVALIDALIALAAAASQGEDMQPTAG